MKGFVSSPARRRLTPALAAAACCVGFPASVMAQNGPGLVAQTRPDATTTTFNDYDWTGLFYTFYIQNYNDPAYYYAGYSSNEYGGNAYGAGSSWFLHWGGFDYGTYGGKIDVSGSATYKWQWFAPDKVDSPGMPDLVNFPVPGTGTSAANPLYVLGRVQGYISATADSSGFTAEGQLLDEWTNATNANLQKFSGLIPPMLSASTLPTQNTGKPTHGIALATLDPDDAGKITLLSLLSPTPFVKAALSSYTESFGELQMQLETHAFVMELGDTNQPSAFADNGGATSLDLFGYADKRGDGKNQFVYNKAGNLYIPVGVNLNGASGDVIPDDTYFLAHSTCAQIVANIAYVNPAPFTFKDTLTGAVPRTPIGNGTNYDGLVYYGLPQSNAALGSHIVKLQINTDPYNLKLAGKQYQDSEIAHIQTFFKDTDFTHPLDASAQDRFPLATQATWPNWFYYYTQVYLQINPNLTNFFYDPAGINGVSYYRNNDDTIHIADSANVPANSVLRLHVFGLRSGQQVVSWIGDLDLKGLDAFIAVAAHEQGHRNDSNGTPNNPPIERSMQAGDIDTDGDELSDGWESAHHFNPAKPDTTGAYAVGLNPIDAGKGDREALCDIQALGALKAYYVGKLYLLDWSVNGTQFGNKLPWPAGQPQWTYTPLDAMMNPGTPTNVLPADALYTLP